MRKLVYIAGPYAAAGRWDDVTANCARAIFLAAYAARIGLCPISPHAMGRAGVYGPPDESEAGTRERALDRGVRMAGVVAVAGGEFWAISRDDGSLSDGTKDEQVEFLRLSYHRSVTVRTWAGWMSFMAAFPGGPVSAAK